MSPFYALDGLNGDIEFGFDKVDWMNRDCWALAEICALLSAFVVYFILLLILV